VRDIDQRIRLGAGKEPYLPDGMGRKLENGRHIGKSEPVSSQRVDGIKGDTPDHPMIPMRQIRWQWVLGIMREYDVWLPVADPPYQVRAQGLGIFHLTVRVVEAFNLRNAQQPGGGTGFRFSTSGYGCAGIPWIF
jgi:hypothetical protein